MIERSNDIIQSHLKARDFAFKAIKSSFVVRIRISNDIADLKRRPPEFKLLLYVIKKTFQNINSNVDYFQCFNQMLTVNTLHFVAIHLNVQSIANSLSLNVG